MIDRRPILDARDCKPGNYRFLSTKLADSDIFAGSLKMIDCIEKLFLKSIIVKPPMEQQVPLAEVSFFEGPLRAQVIFFCSKVATQKRPLSAILINSCHVKYN